MINALIDVATGAVIQWGAVNLVAGPGQAVVSVSDEGVSYPGDPCRYVKVVGGLFVPMTMEERAAVDHVVPQRRAQRVVHLSEVTASTNQTDPGGGWVDVIPLTTADPLLPGAYEIACAFELSLAANSAVHTAQAVLLVDGTEIATWQNPRSAFTRFQSLDPFVFGMGSAPTLRLQIRRLGPGGGTARARRASIIIYPAPTIRAELL